MFRTIADIPYLQARVRGGKTAVVTDAGEAILYAALDDRCRRFAAFLRSRSVAKGERVALLLQNVPEFIVAYFGALSAGCVAVPVNYRLSPPEVAYILADCAASVVVTTADQFDKARRAGRRPRGGDLAPRGWPAGRRPSVQRRPLFRTRHRAGAGRPRRRGRPPVHVGDHGLPQGGDDLPPEHPVQRQLLPRHARATRRGTSGCSPCRCST